MRMVAAWNKTRHAEQKKKCWQMGFITNGWVLSSPQLFVWKPHSIKMRKKKHSLFVLLIIA